MKRAIIPLLLLLFCFFLAACDWGNEITGMSVQTCPDRLVYAAGVDTKLDLAGGTVRFRLRDGRDDILGDMDRVPVVQSDIDFSKPGAYTVTLKQHIASCTFQVVVISKEYIDKYLK